METTLKRRSRMRRQPTNRRVMLTPRDYEILKLLDRYRYLRSTYLHALIGGSQQRFKKRLGALYHELGYIDRPAKQWQAVNARYMPAVYEFSPAGEQILIDNGRMLGGASPLLHRGRGHGVLFQHELMISDILASIEIGIRARHGLRFVSWQDILGKAPQATQKLGEPFDMPVTIHYDFHGTTATCNRALSPDAVFGIRYDVPQEFPYRFFALEADRDSEPVYRSNFDNTSWLRKLLQYLAVFNDTTYRKHLGLPRPLELLVVTTSERQQKQIMELLSELTDDKGHAHILFRTMPSLASLEKAPPPLPFILTDAWHRVGHPDTFIDRI